MTTINRYKINKTLKSERLELALQIDEIAEDNRCYVKPSLKALVAGKLESEDIRWLNRVIRGVHNQVTA